MARNPAVGSVSARWAPPVTTIGPARLTAGMAEYGRMKISAHVRVHGDVDSLSYEELVELAQEISLRGRGGAGFPFAKKVTAVVESADRRNLPISLVVNGSEGEPASWKDKILLTRAPHLILDGAALAARAIDAYEIILCVGPGPGEASLAAALEERSMPMRTRIVVVPDRFISGEGGALVRGINGEGFKPPGRKVLASDSGVGGRPTLLSNAETFAQLAIAGRLGVRGYASVGTSDEPGTVLLTVGGAARSPAVVECPTGISLMDVLEHCQVPPGPGVLVGGYHGSWLGPAAVATAELSRRGLTEVGGALGAGIILPLAADTCPLGEAARVINYLAAQSAGQCGPCRFGLPELARALSAVVTGAGGAEVVAAAGIAARGRGACSHPDGTVRFAGTALATFTEDIAAHAYRGGCRRPVQGQLGVPGPAAEEGTRRLTVDWTRCDAHGLCASVAPELIRLDAYGFPVLPDGPVPTWSEAAGRRAASMCPALALRLVDPRGPAPAAAPTPAPAAVPAGRGR